MLQANPLEIGVAAAVFAVVIVLRARGMRRERPLRVEQLWIVPALMTLALAFVMWLTPPSWADAPWLIGAALIGAGMGWYRGKLMRITVDPATHVVNQSASPWAVLFLLGLLVARYAVRLTLSEEAAAWGISLATLTDAPLVLIVAIFTVARIEMYLRAQKLLRQARAAPREETPS